MNDSTQRRTVGRQTASIPTAVGVDYWVVDAAGGMADPEVVAGLPGATATASPYSVGIETPPCETGHELRAAMERRLAAAVGAAHERECRLLALGVRPDLIDDETALWNHPPATVTAGSRVSFEVPADAMEDYYNILLALDPAFAVVNTTCLADGGCGRPALHRHGSTPAYRTAGATQAGSGRTGREGQIGEPGRTDGPRGMDGPGRMDGPGGMGGLRGRDGGGGRGGSPGADDWRPVEPIEAASRLVWRSLDATTPTLLADLVADVKTILEQASRYRLRIESFGNGFHADRLVLPTAEWRQLYTEAAVRRGLSSLLVRAYLERLGFETGWYRAGATPTVDVTPATDPAAVSLQHAALLEADLGVHLTT